MLGVGGVKECSIPPSPLEKVRPDKNIGKTDFYKELDKGEEEGSRGETEEEK